MGSTGNKGFVTPRFSVFCEGFKSPLSHVFFPRFPRPAPRARHNRFWFRHNFSTKERWVERRESLEARARRHLASTFRSGAAA